MAQAPATKLASPALANAPRGSEKTAASRGTRPRAPGSRTVHSHQVDVPVPATPTLPATPPKRTKVPAAPTPPATPPKPEPAKRRTSKPAAPKRMSALDAAALVLAKSDKPMTAKGMIEVVTARGLWSSPAGKTPHSTLYSAIIREIAAKGMQARFKKHDRGLFTAVRGR